MKKLVLVTLIVSGLLASCGKIEEYSFKQIKTTLEACEAYDLSECVSLQNGFTYEITNDTIDINSTGKYPVTFTIKDENGHTATETLEFTVVDTGRPHMELETDIQVDQGSEFDLHDYVTVNDKYDGDLSDKIEYDISDYDLSTPGKYKVEVTVSDSSGNVSKNTTTITVNKVIAPRENTVIRNVCWGDDSDTIKNNEETDPVYDESFDYDNENGYILKYDDIYVAGKDAKLVYYIHPEHGLYRCCYMFNYNIASDSHFTDYNDLLQELKNKYGEPQDTVRQEDTNGLSKSSALWLGYIYYSDTWVIDNTEITLQLATTNNNKSAVFIHYSETDFDPTYISKNL